MVGALGADDVRAWYDTVGALADGLSVTAEILCDAPTYPQHMKVYHSQGNAYVRFTCADGSAFYGYWQPSQGGGPAPLLVHLPGYDAPISGFPGLVAEGYNVLDINPLGYMTPWGVDGSKCDHSVAWGFPVFLDTARSLGKGGYTLWLAQALAAVVWALGLPGVQPGRVGVFGTSQGGAMSMLLGGLMVDRGLAVGAIASDVPAFCGLSRIAGGHPGGLTLDLGNMGTFTAENEGDLGLALKALAVLDPGLHAPLLEVPVLLTSGSEDTLCPPAGIEGVFASLPSTRSYTNIAGQGHGPTVPFLYMATAWFRMWV